MYYNCIHTASAKSIKSDGIMVLNFKDVAEGKLNGKIVWICDYNYPVLRDSKPLRNVPPTRVLIRDNSETTKNIYYSESHFVVLNKDGGATKKVHALFDNTGFRHRTGNPLHIFDTQNECEAKYVELLKTVMLRLEQYKQNIISECNSQIEGYSKLITKFNN